MRLAMILSVGIAAAVLTTLGTAGGPENARAVVEHIFAMADQDRSGTLTRSEYAEARLERFGVSFEECDANGDGETSMAEYLAVYERHHPSGEHAEI